MSRCNSFGSSLLISVGILIICNDKSKLLPNRLFQQVQEIPACNFSTYQTVESVRIAQSHCLMRTLLLTLTFPRFLNILRNTPQSQESFPIFGNFLSSRKKIHRIISLIQFMTILCDFATFYICAIKFRASVPSNSYFSKLNWQAWD